MLTRDDYKKLGIPYVDQSAEARKIDIYATNLFSKIDNLRRLIPFITSVPADTQSEGKPGNIAIDSEYFYICIATNSWKRIQLNEI